jgi:hypothetical protein
MKTHNEFDFSRNEFDRSDGVMKTHNEFDFSRDDFDRSDDLELFVKQAIFQTK